MSDLDGLRAREAGWDQYAVEGRRGSDEGVVAEARRLCLIQAGSEDFKPLDFHRFRRAFATGLAARA
jgi:hypothetical protein